MENYALDALLTDDASRISDEDLKELSRNASQCNSVNASPAHSKEVGSNSELTFGQLIDHDMSMIVDDNDIMEFEQEENNNDHIITDVKDRFLKLDHLFGQISAAIEQDEASWIRR